MRTEPSPVKCLGVILFLGLVVRLALWTQFDGIQPRIADEQEYVNIARNVAERGEYAYRPGMPTSIRPPLYPVLVAGVYAVAGVDNFQAVRLAQAVLSLGTSVLVFLLARRLYTARTGLWAAGFATFYPSLLGFNNLLLTEVVFIFLTVAAVLATVAAVQAKHLPLVAAAAALFGLAALTRSILYPFAPVLCVYLLVAWDGSAVRRIVAAVAFAAVFAAVLAPWAVRNTRLHQTVIPIDCMGGRNFMIGNYEHTPLYRSWAAIDITGENNWLAVLKRHKPGDWGAVTQGQIDQLAMKEAARFVAENPGLTARRSAVKFFDFWGLERELVAGAREGYFGPMPAAGVVGLAVVVCGAYALALFAGVFGLAVTRPADLKAHALILLLSAHLCGVHTLVFAHSRYHLPVMPFLMIYAAALVTGPRVGGRRTAGVVAALACLLIVGGWGWNALAGDFDKLQSLFTR